MHANAERAVRRLAQLTEESPYNRSERPSMPRCQMLALETGFGSYPDVMAQITATEEWQQMAENSALHPEQFKAFAERWSAEV